MDPLSIVASAITVAAALSTTLETIRNVSQANNELLALTNEVSDMSIVLSEVDYVCLEHQAQGDSSPRSVSSLSNLVEAAEFKMSELNRLIRRMNEKVPPRLSSRLNWLRSGCRARALQEDLQRIRNNITTVLSTVLSSSSKRIELDIREVFLVTRDMVANQARLHAESKAERLETNRTLEGLAMRIANLHTSGNLPEAEHEGRSASAQTSHLPSAPDIELASPVQAFQHSGQVLVESSEMTAISAVGIRTAQFNKAPCIPWCSCCCHVEGRLRSPVLLDAVFGSLFIGYSGLPINRRPCNEHSCRQRAIPMTYITYFFPRWFLARMVSLMLAMTPLAGPVASLKVRRTVPGTAKLFKLAQSGDVEKLKSLFEKGLASPHDVHFESGVTALHVSAGKHIPSFDADSNDRVASGWTRAAGDV